jgi:hypothetical protein
MDFLSVLRNPNSALKKLDLSGNFDFNDHVVIFFCKRVSQQQQATRIGPRHCPGVPFQHYHHLLFNFNPHFVQQVKHHEHLSLQPHA